MITSIPFSRPLFNEPQWLWYATEEDISYPCINNIVEVEHTRRGSFQVVIAVPTELYIILKHQKIKYVYGFTLVGKLFSMMTDKGVIDLWEYKTYPKWINQ
ncbi:MAG: hypothetical protein DRG09_04745 [Epsilonproteobacteria bacterium]|nr:MAG: hypothetical protein DRG09_04745 [Campylobacterota bacterium]